MKGQWIVLKLVLMCVVLGYPSWSGAFVVLPWVRDRFCWAIEPENVSLLKTAIATEASRLIPLGWRNRASKDGSDHTYESECDSDGLCILSFFLELRENRQAQQLWVYDYREQRFSYRRTEKYLEMSKRMDELLAPFVSRKALGKDCFAVDVQGSTFFRYD